MYRSLEDLQADLQDCIACLQAAKSGTSPFLENVRNIYGEAEFEGASFTSHQKDAVRHAARRLLDACEYEMKDRQQELIDYGYPYLDYLRMFWVEHQSLLEECLAICQ